MSLPERHTSVTSCANLTLFWRLVVEKHFQSFAEAFRKAYNMDFYITKYQGKMMQSLTPLFQTMTQGIHRLAEDEQAEDAKAEENSGEAEHNCRKR